MALCSYLLCIHLIIFSDCKEVLEALSNISFLPGVSTEGTVKRMRMHCFSLGYLLLEHSNCSGTWFVYLPKWHGLCPSRAKKFFLSSDYP